MEYEVRAIKMNQLAPGMVLVEPVLDMNNKVLIPEGTEIVEVDFNLLIYNGVREIFIRADTFVETVTEIADPVRRKDFEERTKSVTERDEFFEFKKTYKEKVEQSRKSILSISNGENVDIVDLYNMTNEVLSPMKYRSDVFAFLHEVKEIDLKTYAHSTNVGVLCNIFGNWLNYDDIKLMMLTASGILHDSGKIKIPTEILNKEGVLSQDESKIMESHPIHGYRMLQQQPDIPEEIRVATLMHHEKINGSGYPLGAKDKQISDFAKIVSICDIFDTLTTDRAYKEKMSPFDVIRDFKANVFGEIDIELMDIFLQNIAKSYVGAWVTLSDGRDAEILFINDKNILQPIVRDTRGELTDLYTSTHLKIMKLA